MMDHIEQFKFLKICFEKNPQYSWIFYGPKGVGKYKFTIELIKNVTKIKNFNQNIFEINNPDKPALIEDIRELISKIKLTNSSSDDIKTFFLIHQMEILNLNCINALLKTIEEPPENTSIIIFAQNLKNIPKTILSRCIKLKFKPNDCKLFIEKKEVQKDDFFICNYNPNIFKILTNEKGKEIKKKTMIILNKKHFELNDFYLLYEKISDNFHNYLSVILSIIFFDIKSKVTSNIFDLDKTKSALFYLDFIKKISINDIKIDKRKVLHLIFSEYFKYKLND